MKLASVSLLMSALAIVQFGVSGQSAPRAASIPVADVAFTDRPVIVILPELATRYKVVIGVSGVWNRSNETLVSVSIPTGTVKDVLDALVRENPSFTWQQEDDGGILVLTSGAPVSVLDVVVKTFDTDHPRRFELGTQIRNLPEIKEWEKKNGCRMTQIISVSGANPAQYFGWVWPIEVHVKNMRLETLLKRIALESEKYSWSVVRYKDPSCSVILYP